MTSDFGWATSEAGGELNKGATIALFGASSSRSTAAVFLFRGFFTTTGLSRIYSMESDTPFSSNWFFWFCFE
jgi:hypothetical protein